MKASIQMIMILVLLLIGVAASCSRRIVDYQEVHDSRSLPRNFSREGRILIMEDYNYWPTNSIAYLGDEKILFFDAPWANATAQRMLWKASVASPSVYGGLVITDYRLHRSGSMDWFAKAGNDIFMHRSGYLFAREHWNRMQDSMERRFSTWKRTEFVKPRALLGDRVEMMNGEIVIYHPGDAYAPGNLIVHFTKEKVVYAGSLLSVQPFYSPHMDRAKMEEALDFVAGLDFDTIISGHGKPVQGRRLLKKIRQRLNQKDENL